jgi:hypothetical protein
MDFRQQGPQGYFQWPFQIPGSGGGGGKGNYDQRLDRIERRLDRHSQRLNRINRRLQRVERQLGIGGYENY